jgi:hypothetical protein
VCYDPASSIAFSYKALRVCSPWTAFRQLPAPAMLTADRRKKGGLRGSVMTALPVQKRQTAILTSSASASRVRAPLPFRRSNDQDA